MFLWVCLVIIVPTSNAILALTFANYLLQLFYSVSPEELVVEVRIISATVIALLTAVNCYDVKWGAWLQLVFTVVKLLAIFFVIMIGLIFCAMDKIDFTHFNDTFQEWGPGKISLSLHSGMYSYSGWNYLNFVVEEIKDPFDNLPRAIWISLPFVTAIYFLVNLAYFAVLSKSEILESIAVAVTFEARALGIKPVIMPVLVACSAFGGLNGAIFAPSRIIFVGAREGLLPRALAIVNSYTFTPIPSLVFLGLLSIVMVLTKDVYTLINYSSFVETLSYAVSVLGLLWLRYKKPDMARPIKMPIMVPILFAMISVFMVAVPVVTSPVSEIGVAVIIILIGIPIYAFIVWERKPQFLKNLDDAIYQACTVIFHGVAEFEKDD